MIANVVKYNFHNDSLYLETLLYTDTKGNTLIIQGDEAISFYNVNSSMFAGELFTWYLVRLDKITPSYVDVINNETTVTVSPTNVNITFSESFTNSSKLKV